MIRAAVDVSPLVQTRAGTSRHVRGLLGALAGREGIEVTPRSFGGSGKAASLARDTWWYYAGLPRSARGSDLLHCTTFRGPLRASVPFAVTLHDLALVRHPELFPRWHRLSGRAGIGPVARAADRVFVVSEFTKREAVELLGVSDERVVVIGNAIEPVFTSEGPAADGDYVLAVATLEPRKNLRRIADAATRVGAELRVVGARGWGGVATPGWVGEVSDEELAALYRGARAFVFPSLYEGFGIPVLEAMACGAPVVTSRGGATEEVAGGAAALVDPLDAGAIAAGIEEAVTRRAELRALGLERAHAYSWPYVADAVERVWRELA
ncbi:MAG TPA: glycosyltransferase family 1 protein [Gaiellaceae bacterium]|nr:glycosyltransferase family 1 protein [Gaiellaceae bacterium]